MKASLLSIALLGTLGVAMMNLSFAGPPAPKAAGIESKGYTWNSQEGEKSEALKLKGDKANGEEAYEVCGACHLPSGAGRPDGTFPQLAGQHTTVLIKQMADIRAGLRQPDDVSVCSGFDRPAGTRRCVRLYREPVHSP